MDLFFQSIGAKQKTQHKSNKKIFQEQIAAYNVCTHAPKPFGIADHLVYKS